MNLLTSRLKFLCWDLTLKCSKERSFDINLSTLLTQSVCVAYCERGSDRSLSDWLLLRVKHSHSANNSALQCLQSFIWIYNNVGSTFFALLRQQPCIQNRKSIPAYKISLPASQSAKPKEISDGFRTRGFQSHFFRLRLRSCSKILESGSGYS